MPEGPHVPSSGAIHPHRRRRRRGRGVLHRIPLGRVRTTRTTRGDPLLTRPVGTAGTQADERRRTRAPRAPKWATRSPWAPRGQRRARRGASHREGEVEDRARRHARRFTHPRQQRRQSRDADEAPWSTRLSTRARSRSCAKRQQAGSVVDHLSVGIAVRRLRAPRSFGEAGSRAR